MTPASKMLLAALCAASLLAQASAALPARASPHNRRLASGWVGSGSHDQGSSATLWAEDTTAQSIDAAANGDSSPAAAARTGVITGEIATYETQQGGGRSGHWVGKRRALLDLGSGRASSATLWAEDTTAQSIDAAANGDSSPAAAARTGVITGEIATYETQRGSHWVGGRRLAARAQADAAAHSPASVHL